MGQTTPNIGIYVPSAGETNYDAAFLAGMINIDQHDHTGGPNKGVPISSGGLADGSVTFPKLNANVADTSTGIGVSGANPNQLVMLGLLASIYQNATATGFLGKNGATAFVRTLTGTANQIAITNGDGVSGDPTFGLAAQTTLSTQPGFLATVSGALNNVTGDGTDYTVIFGTETYDVGGVYDNTTGIFTAPVTGKYLLCCELQFENLVVGFTDGEVYFKTTTEDYNIARFNFYEVGLGGSRFCGVSGSAIVPMTAGDTASVQLLISQASLTVDVSGDPDRVKFSAQLLV